MTGRHQEASQWLRAHTRDEHAAAEAGLDLGRLRTPTELAGFLRAWTVVWQQIRCAAGVTGAAAVAGPELQEPAHQSLAWLATDLACLGASPPGQPVDDRPPRPEIDHRTHVAGGPVTELLSRPARVWGTAYVLRGSRLGGRFLAVPVAAALGLAPGCGTAFLTSTGTDTGAEWVAFRRRLDGAVRTGDELADAGAAARRVFGWVAAELAAGLAAGLAAAPTAAGTPVRVS